MTLMIDRRSLLLTGALGIAALAVPGVTWAQTIGAAAGFTHGVASGEPASDSLLFWTRYVPTAGGPVELKVEVADTPAFARVVAGGVQITGPWRDHTAKITLAGLRPGTTYWFRFIAPDGTMSPVGRSRTLPEGLVPSFKAAIFSCSNLSSGWFNAYGHAAARDDLDCTVHLGDYFYEYGSAHQSPADVVGGRVPMPSTELIHLADYRLRYASYRADPDLQALHARLPMIAQWDDHESSNDSWEGGAQNHEPATEGDWLARRAAAVQAYREWMPVSDEPWKAYDIGTLATLYRTETRLLARTRQPDVAALFKSADPTTALRAFRDGAWADPGTTMMGSQQEVWLDHAMRASVKAGQRWQVVGFGTIMGQTMSPPEAESWQTATGKPSSYVSNGIAAAKAGLPSNFDNWGGYPAARARFLRSAQAMDADLVVISGDSHNAWAYDLAQDGRAAGVEFAGHSVTSRGYEGSIRTDPRRVAAALVRANPELKWCDTSRRGYMAMTLTPERVRNDWVFSDTVLRHTPASSIGHTAIVTRGRRVMA